MKPTKSNRTAGVQTATAPAAPTANSPENRVEAAIVPARTVRPINIGSDGSESHLGRGRQHMAWKCGVLLATFPELANTDFRKPGNHAKYSPQEMFDRVSRDEITVADIAPDSPAWNKSEGMEEKTLAEFVAENPETILPVFKGQLKVWMEKRLDDGCELHFPAKKKENPAPAPAENPENKPQETTEVVA